MDLHGKNDIYAFERYFGPWPFVSLNALQIGLRDLYQ